jgi:hypothetical protein
MSVTECGNEGCYSGEPHERSCTLIDAYCATYGKRVNVVPYKKPCRDIDLAFDDLLEELC